MPPPENIAPKLAVPATQSPIRYEGLDQLRGILAFSVMIYHYADWQNLYLPRFFQAPLELLGLYAVSTFYTLSGCALYLVYHNRSIDRAFFSEFWIKRTFRIVPLFWLVSAAAIGFEIYGNLGKIHEPSGWKIFLNFSLLFSWLDPSAYFATGAWSIGNEWAFYTLFPLILLASRKKWSTVALAFGVSTISAWFAFVMLDENATVADQWKTYIHPLNQLILFVGGVLIGPYVSKTIPRLRFPYYVMASLALFVLISYLATVDECIIGAYRLILAGICMTCCAGFGITRLKHGRVSMLLSELGGISYTVYLTHPLIHHVVAKFLGKLQSILGETNYNSHLLNSTVFIGAVIATIITSSCIYRIIEKPAIRLGKKLAGRNHVSV